MALIVEEAHQELLRLSRLIDSGIDASRTLAVSLAEAENAYRKAKAIAWVECPHDAHDVKGTAREWTAARREAWVDGETADLRRDRDLAEGMSQVARDAIRARQAQMSALQSLLRAHMAEADLARTFNDGP